MFLLILVFILVPIAELYVIIQVGGAIGVGPTIALLILDGFLGAFLLRQQGRAAWVRFNRALAENRIPHKEVLDGVLIIFGGALLLTPGFLTDIVGLIFLIPPSRAIVRAFMARIVRGRLTVGPRAATWGYGRVRRRDARQRPAPEGPAPGGPAPGSPGGPPPGGRPGPD
ncbi:MAG: FxsA family protein, partial [Solirubrobacterales bacterium]